MSEESIVDLVNGHMGGEGVLKSPNDVPPSGHNTPMPSVAAPEGSVNVNAPTDTVDMQTLKGLLSKVQDKGGWQTVKLPSNGHAYNGLTEVQIRAFTWEEELQLKTNEDSDAHGFAVQVMSQCVKGLDMNYCTLPDRNFLLYAIRQIAYGTKYPMDSTCAHKGCGKINELVIELDKLPIVYAEKSLNTSTIMLPDSENECVVRHPATKDEPFMADMKDSYMNLGRFVLSVGAVKDGKLIHEFLKRTTVADINTVYEAVYNTGYGMETKVLYDCAKCGRDNKLHLELNASFFTPS